MLGVPWGFLAVVAAIFAVLYLLTLVERAARARWSRDAGGLGPAAATAPKAGAIAAKTSEDAPPGVILVLSIALDGRGREPISKRIERVTARAAIPGDVLNDAAKAFVEAEAWWSRAQLRTLEAPADLDVSFKGTCHAEHDRFVPAGARHDKDAPAGSQGFVVATLVIAVRGESPPIDGVYEVERLRAALDVLAKLDPRRVPSFALLWFPPDPGGRLSEEELDAMFGALRELDR